MKTRSIFTMALLLFTLLSVQAFAAASLDQLNRTASPQMNKMERNLGGNNLRGLHQRGGFSRQQHDLTEANAADPEEEGDLGLDDVVDDEDTFEDVVKDTESALKKNPAEKAAKDADEVEDFQKALDDLDEDIEKLDEKF